MLIIIIIIIVVVTVIIIIINNIIAVIYDYKNDNRPKTFIANGGGNAVRLSLKKN